MSPLGCSFLFFFFFFIIFLARFIADASIVSVCLVCDSSIVVICPSIPAARFPFCLCFIQLFLLFVVVLSGEPKQKQWRGLIDRSPPVMSLVQAPPPPPLPPPSNFIAGRPKAALLFWFFGDFKRGVLLFMIILLIYKYRNR